jgi:hypothetical protein
MPASNPKPATNQTERRRRRRHPRFRDDFGVAVTLFLGSHYHKVEGHCRDLSEAGIGVLLATELTVGEVAGLSFSLPKSLPWETRAVLRYRRGYHYGFEFLALSTEQQELLKAHLKSLKAID